MSKAKPKKEIPRPIIVLSILSITGVMLSGMSDFSYYTLLDQYVTEGIEEGTAAAPFLKKLGQWEEAGIDVSVENLKMIRQTFFITGMLGIISLLGVGLMFFRMKIGFAVYTIGQLVYIAVPLYLLGSDFYPNFRTLHYGDLAIMLLFIVMWRIQHNIAFGDGVSTGSQNTVD